MDPELTGAPASPDAATTEPTETLAADYAAAASNDFASFQKAAESRREGKPLDPVQPAPERALSKRQQDINRRAQEASERAVKDATSPLQQEIAQLRERLQGLEGAHAARPEVQAETRKKELGELARFAKMPDAPKLADFMEGDQPITLDQFQSYQAAMATFTAQKLGEERAAADRPPADAPDPAMQAEIESFGTQMRDAVKADPAFLDKLSTDVKEMRPLVGGARGIIAKLIFGSSIGTQHALHFSQHPDLLAQLEALPPHLAQQPESEGRIRAHIQHIVQEFGKLDGALRAAAPQSPSQSTRRGSPITSAAPPPRVISTPGSNVNDDEFTAATRGDFASFSAHRRNRIVNG